MASLKRMSCFSSLKTAPMVKLVICPWLSTTRLKQTKMIAILSLLYQNDFRSRKRPTHHNQQDNNSSLEIMHLRAISYEVEFQGWILYCEKIATNVKNVKTPLAGKLFAEHEKKHPTRDNHDFISSWRMPTIISIYTINTRFRNAIIIRCSLVYLQLTNNMK